MSRRQGEDAPGSQKEPLTAHAARDGTGSHRAVGLVRTRRFGPGEVVHVIAVRLHGIVIQGHGHGVQLMASVHLPLFDPLEPVG